jgi:transcriptional regulator with GAF, ATPase, and Fis domain/tetratricopeptide (TPR) repeat protein
MERFADRYLLLRKLGRGGMGEVFLARDLSRGTECALKRLTPGGADTDAKLLQKEFESLAAIRHPTIVPVYERGVAPDGTAYLTMEYVPGLAAERAVKPGDWPALYFVAARVAGGLEALHAAGILHGDMKPSNVLVVPGGPRQLPVSVRLVDFGLAGFLGRDTKAHQGTPGYAAPEVVKGWKADVASDLYGLGATLYHLAVGRAPYADEKGAGVLRAQQSGPPASLPLEDAGCPPELAELILRLMALAPRERPESAGEVRRELERMHPAAHMPLERRLDTAVVVGREKELGFIERRGASTRKRAQIVLISGAPGAGKSALLGELSSRAVLREEPVLRGSGAGAAIPGAAALELVRLLAARVPAAEDDDASVRRRVADVDATIREQDIPQILEAVTRWMRRVSGPLRILIDDAEQLDSLSSQTIRRWMLHPHAPPALWVLARRLDGQKLSDEDDVLVRAGVAGHLPLSTLSKESIARLTSVRLAAAAPDALVDVLWERAGGHPGLTVEILRAAAAAGAIDDGDSGLTIDRAKLGAVQSLGSFEESLLARLHALPPASGTVALALAVWNRPVAVERLRVAAPGVEEDDIAPLVASGLAARDPAHRLALRPPALAGRVLAAAESATRDAMRRRLLETPDLTPIERFDHLHALGDVEGALAEAQRVFEKDADTRVAIAAAELAAVSVPETAAEWYEKAARELMRRGLAAEVPPLIERALELAPRSERRFRWWELLARSQSLSRAIEASEQTIALALAQSPPPRDRALLTLSQATNALARGSAPEALRLAEDAMTLPGAEDDDEVIVSGCLAKSAGLIREGRLEEARHAAERAVEMAQQLSDSLRESTGIGNLAIIESLSGNRLGLPVLYSRAVDLARKSGSLAATQQQMGGLASGLEEAGRWGEARKVRLDAYRLGLEHGLGRWTALAAANLALSEALAGQPRPAVRHADVALKMASVYSPVARSAAKRALAAACRVGGDMERARAHATSAQRGGRGVANTSEWLTLEIVWALMGLGRWTEASATARRVPPGEAQRSLGWICLRLLAGIASARLGEREDAEAILSLTDKCLADNPAPYAKALADTLRALLHFHHGRKDEGVRAAEMALKEFDQLPAPPDRAWAAYQISRAALDISDPPVQLGGWLESAARTFERLGDHRHRAQALGLQLRWSRRAGAPVSSGTDGTHLIEQVSLMLASFAEPAEVAHRAMKMVGEQLGAERGSLLVIDRESNRLLPIAEIGTLDSGARKEVLSYSRRVVKRVTESGIGLLTGDVATDPSMSSLSLRDLGIKSVICVPVHLGGHVIGAIYLDDSRRSGVFSEQDQSLLEGFSHLMAITIERSREHAEVLDANERLVTENVQLRRKVSERHSLENLVGSSSRMRQVIAEVEQAATNDSRVLITGEMGTGKEFVARTLHELSKRRRQPFVMLNCGAITESLLESELFGILPHVATNVKARPGRFVEANGGTLFLDEVGEMPLAQQVALLSVLSRPTPKGEVTPVGGGRPVPVDVRVIAATNQDLREMVRQKKFREDLYYRLAVIPIELPPLRERKADIPALAAKFLREFAEAQQRPVPEMSPAFIAALLQSDWPGNVRELQNYVERVLSMTTDQVLQPKPLPNDLRDRAGTIRVRGGRKLLDMVSDLERNQLREALGRANGNQSLAARELGLTEQSMRYKIRKYRLESAREKRRVR